MNYNKSIFELFQDATLFAKRVHSGQMYGDLPFMEHVKDVMRNALRFELEFTQILAAILHDTIEDGNVSREELEERFGESVADLVELVTDEPGRNRKERKFETYKKLRGHPEAIAVKLCDRIANIRYCLDTLDMKNLTMYVEEDSMFCALDDGHTNRALWREYCLLISPITN